MRRPLKQCATACVQSIRSSYRRDRRLRRSGWGTIADHFESTRCRRRRRSCASHAWPGIGRCAVNFIGRLHGRPGLHQTGRAGRRQWLESGDPSVQSDHQDYEEWWTVFHDPALDRLIDIAYRQNLTLMAAGTRVLEARATLGVAIGEFYPQTQQIGANVGYNQASQVDPTSNPLHQLENYWRASLGTQIAWELDFWGKFRRGVESADASYLASIATYDDVLVTLLGDVATTYIGIRTLQQQIDIARDNVVKQRKALAIAQRPFPRRHRDRRSTCIRRENVLAQTESTIPQLTAQLQQGEDALRVLLGMTPAVAGRLLAGPDDHTGAAERRRGRHSGRSDPPPAGHSQRRTQGRRPERPDRHRQGRSVPGIQPDRRVRHRGRHVGRQPCERGVQRTGHPVCLRSHRSVGRSSTTARSPTTCGCRTRACRRC